MSASLKRLRAFGKHVGRAQDAVLRGPVGKDAIREARALWLSSPVEPKGARGGAEWRPFLGIASALALAACVLLFLRAERVTPMTFQVGPGDKPGTAEKGAGTSGVAGQWVAAGSAEPLPLHFSDGSLVRLERSARARVVDVTDTGGRVALENGAVHAEIVHREKTRWSVEAGPFEVRVTGTKFDVAWDPSPRAFTITLLEGSVAVSGCDLAAPQVVTTGQTFHATCHEDAPVSAEIPPSAPAAPGAAARPAEVPAVPPCAIALPQVAPAPPPDPAVSLPSRAPTANAAVVPREKPTWREALSLGRHAEALELAEAEGLSSVCASADVGALMDLSDAARFAGHVDRAKVILLEVRRRFPGDPRASEATFDLGRIAFDDEAAFADAALWFDRYLTELPGGALAREASGRRMEALEKNGDHAGAVRAARAYLDGFPTGPHAKLARSIETQ